MAALGEKHWQVSGTFVEQSIIFSESRANIVQQTAVKYLHYCSQFTQQGVEIELSDLLTQSDEDLFWDNTKKVKILWEATKDDPWRGTLRDLVFSLPPSN